MLTLAAVALLSGNGCGPQASPSPSSASDATVTPEQPAFTRLASGPSSGFTEASELVVADEAALAQTWLTIHQGVAGVAAPRMDFARNSVVLLTLGGRSSGGYQIRFDGVTRGAPNVVRYTVTSPGPGCMTTQMMSSPYDVVSVSRLEGATRFERREAVDKC